MLFVFFLAIAPKEYIHDVLFHHHDTVHPLYKKGEVVITGKHIHCSFLGFSFAAFVNGEKQTLSFKVFPFHTGGYLVPDYCYRYSSSHIAYSLRGPPDFNLV